MTIYGDASWLDTAGRLLIVSFYLAAGARTVTPAQVKDHLARLAAFGVPFPAAAFWTGMALQFGGCALVLFDWHAEIGVLCLIVFTVTANALYHRYWTAEDPVKNYRLRPVRIVSPFAVGGNSDIVGRLLAPRLAERLGQNFIVENRPGAGGITGTSYVARATPDGHTLLIASGAFTSVAAVTKKLPYDALRDFSWISMVVAYPFVVVVKAEAPMRTVEDLIASAKRTPGKLVYGSVGTGSVFHLAAEMFSTMTGTEMLHVPYKGGAEPVTELIGGRIHVIFTTPEAMHKHVTDEIAKWRRIVEVRKIDIQ